MRLSWTLSYYFGKHFLLALATVIAVLAGLAFLIDLVEVLGRTSGKEQAGFAVVMKLAILQMPMLLERIAPFAALFGALLSLVRLNASSEVVVARAAGFSVWQILLPLLTLSLFIGFFMVGVFNPITAVTYSQYEQLQDKYLRGKSRLVAVSEKNGLWLRENTGDGRYVLHAGRVSDQGSRLEDVIIFNFGSDDSFIDRIDARQALLSDGAWQLTEVLKTAPGRQAERLKRLRVGTSLTPEQIMESVASPYTLSFWELPSFIDTLEKAGFANVKHQLRWQGLLAFPLLLTAMVLIAATFALRFNKRKGGVLWMLGGCVLTGFFVFLFSNIVYSSALHGGLPVILGAWSPAIVSAMIGGALLFHLEDG